MDTAYHWSPCSLTVVASQVAGAFLHVPGIKGGSGCLMTCCQPPGRLPFQGLEAAKGMLGRAAPLSLMMSE